jgi:hypothetical protein
MGDFNKSGEHYETLAIAGEPSHYNLLPIAGCKFYEDLQRHLCEKWRDEPNSPELKRWSACLDRLGSFLYQMTRIPSHMHNLQSKIPPKGQMLCASGVTALADFESLLYLGRSALDRITFAIAKQTYSQNCEKFQRLPNVLKNFTNNDNRAKGSIDVINAVLSDFEGVLINHSDGTTGLRSILAHSRSTGESSNHGFSVHRTSETKVLFFDLELDGYGVINTAHKLNRSISFVILRLIALYTDYKGTLTLKDCIPAWDVQCICLSDYIDTTGNGVRFSTARISACGFQPKTYHVKNTIYANAIEIDLTKPSIRQNS